MNINLRFVPAYVLSAGLALLFCAPARAGVVSDWTYSSNLFTVSYEIIAESTLTAGTSGFAGYQILDLSDSWDSQDFTQLLPPDRFDNSLPDLLPPQLASGGLAFTNTDTNFIISYPPFRYGFDHHHRWRYFCETEPTPEPATAVLLIPILLAFALFVRRQSRPLQRRSGRGQQLADS